MINKRKVLWLCAPCKSGSTWLSAMLDHYLQWEVCSIAPVDGRREQEVNVNDKFLTFKGNLFLPHTHTRASDSTLRIVNAHDIRVIVLARNLADTLVSLDDHCCHWGVHVPVGFIPNGYATWADDERYDFLVDIVAPWYLNFYVSWLAAIDSTGGRIMFIKYDALTNCATAQIARCCKLMNIPYDLGHAKRAEAKAHTSGTRFNVGKHGRGRAKLGLDRCLDLEILAHRYGATYTNRLLNLAYEPRSTETAQEQSTRENGVAHPVPKPLVPATLADKSAPCLVDNQAKMIAQTPFDDVAAAI